MIYFVFIVWLCLAFLVLFLMVSKGCLLESDPVYTLAFSKFGKYLPIPIFITCALTLIPIVWENLDKTFLAYTELRSKPNEEEEKKYYYEIVKPRRDYFDDKKTIFVAGLVLSIVAFIGFFFIYLTLGNCSGVASFLFKKCYLSWTMAYLLWYFIDCCFELNLHIFIYKTYYCEFYTYDRIAKKYNVIVEEEESHKCTPPTFHPNARKKAGYACLVLYPILIGVFSWVFKDVAIAACALFLIMGQFIISAKARKPHCMDEKIEYLGSFKEKDLGNPMNGSKIFFINF